MESSPSEQILYNKTTKRFTQAGHFYINSYFIETRYPTNNQFAAIEKHTGCPVSTLRRKFGRMRKQFPLLTYVPLRIINTINFLNTITMEEAIALKTQILDANTYEFLINPKHVNEKITINEISSFTSNKIHDGKYLKDFMSCLIKSDNFNHSSKHDSFINITPACTTWSSIKESAKNFCTSHSINKLRIPIHYICLRARLPILPSTLLEGNVRISRLCSTNGCIREEHIVMENTSISTGREHCGGIIVVLRPYGPTASKRILKIQPCEHGVQHVDGDSLNFSCRKMQVSILDEIAIAYLDSLYKTCSS
ncbi:unnamed protein product [Rotaria sordida]|uniref:Uncharacterized protein n=1 Tax=Rotaria sordida TaxID=392033 RepID=A0A815GB84_9BILA|nr:unnamed protein product [Rotaria sordida]